MASSDTTPNSPAKQRIDWIDYAKVVALYLMVIGHHNVGDSILQWIYSFHMPLFFFFAGVFFKPRTPKEVLKKDFKALLIPFLIINAICLVWTLFIRFGYYHTPLHGSKGFVELVFLSLLGCGQTIPGMPYPVCIFTWFFIALFYIHIIASLGWRNLTPYLIAVAAVSIVAAVLLSEVPMYTPIGSALMAFPFFALGYLLKGISTIRPSIWWCLVSLIVATGLHFVLSIYSGRVDINNMEFGHNIVLFYLTAIIGIIMATSLSIILSRISGPRLRSWVTDLSVGSMVVVGLQGMPIFLSTKVMVDMAKYGINANFLTVLILTLLIMFAFVAVVRLCRKYFPIILGGRT